MKGLLFSHIYNLVYNKQVTIDGNIIMYEMFMNFSRKWIICNDQVICPLWWNHTVLYVINRTIQSKTFARCSNQTHLHETFSRCSNQTHLLQQSNTPPSIIRKIKLMFLIEAYSQFYTRVFLSAVYNFERFLRISFAKFGKNG